MDGPFGDTAEKYLTVHTERLAGLGVASVNAKVLSINKKLTEINKGPVKF